MLKFQLKKRITTIRKIVQKYQVLTFKIINYIIIYKTKIEALYN